MLRQWSEYLYWGGLPESVNLSVKRDYLTSTLQKIYLGDIVSRNKISNPNLLRLLLKKLAESVRQPVSYNRLSNVLSSVSGKITMPTVSKYIEYSEDLTGSCCAYAMSLPPLPTKRLRANTIS